MMSEKVWKLRGSEDLNCPNKSIVIDSQLELNHFTHRFRSQFQHPQNLGNLIREDGSTVTVDLHIQILQKHGPHLSIKSLLQSLYDQVCLSSLSTKGNNFVVRSLVFHNLSVSSLEAKLLYNLLTHANSSLKSLYVDKLEPCGLSSLLEALKSPTCPLHEVHIRFRSVALPENVALTLKMCEVFQRSMNLTLRSVSFVGFPLFLPSLQNEFAHVLHANPGWRELSLRSCSARNSLVRHWRVLGNAIYQHPNLQRVDLTQNNLEHDSGALQSLFKSSRLQYLALSQNYIGNTGHDPALLHALRNNISLREIRLDMNPITEDFAAHTLLPALVQNNTTLTMINLAPLSTNRAHTVVSSHTVDKLLYYVNLNAAGRGWWPKLGYTDTEQQNEIKMNIHDTLSHRIVDHLSTLQDQTSTIFGLLRENPALLLTTMQCSVHENTQFK